MDENGAGVAHEGDSEGAVVHRRSSYEVFVKAEDAIDYEEILDTDADIPLASELVEIEKSGLVEQLAQEESSNGNAPLPDERVVELFGQIAERGEVAGDAIAELYDGNQGLVKSIVGRYRRKDSWLSFEDLVLEGNIGLLTAIQKFDAGKGAKFSTFAYGTIRGRVLKAQEKDPRVVKPFSRLSSELLDLMDEFYAANKREAVSNKELLEFAKDMKDEDGEPIWTAERLKRAALKLRQSQPASSLDAPLDGEDEGGDGGDDGLTAGDLQAGAPEKRVNEEASEKSRIEAIERAIDEADLGVETATLLKSFLRDPSGIYDDDTVISLLDNPTKDDIDRRLRDGLKNRRLKSHLRDRGLLDDK